VPAGIVESTTVVRATLFMTQIPSSGPVAADSLIIEPRIVQAGVQVEPGKAAQLLADHLVAGQALQSRRLVPGGSGEVSFDIINEVLRFRTDDPTKMQRAIVFGSSGEGSSPGQVIFYSSEASNPALRPRLRITYVPRVNFGLP
jgi:hypothetical protein